MAFAESIFLKNAPPQNCDSRRMRRMLGVMLRRYDFITRGSSYGMDRGRKRQSVECAGFPAAPTILDLACGITWPLC
jgi:ubiquinone/menaquinone biosynthesis C-methylase UbiE